MFSEDFFNNQSSHEIKRILEDNADHIKEGEYFKPLTEDELRGVREKFAETAIEFKKLKEELKKVQNDFKSKMFPVENSMTVLLQSIRSRGNTINGTLYFIANHEDGNMDVYNSDGQLVESRRLRPDEKTQTIKFLNQKTA